MLGVQGRLPQAEARQRDEQNGQSPLRRKQPAQTGHHTHHQRLQQPTADAGRFRHDSRCRRQVRHQTAGYHHADQTVAHGPEKVRLPVDPTKRTQWFDQTEANLRASDGKWRHWSGKPSDLVPGETTRSGH
uniref:(northern house mosquito) hypothetical protein n=1 Tax=Culex pipiens TaxID=7175 RepID=A0A8D8BIX7_CULPI